MAMPSPPPTPTTAAAARDRDLEAEPLKPRAVARTAAHGAAPGVEEDGSDAPLLTTADGSRADAVWKTVKGQKSMAKVMKLAATAVEGPWTQDTDDIPGNIYSILAFGSHHIHRGRSAFMAFAWTMAPTCVLLIQLVGNASIAVYNYPLMVDMNIGINDWSKKPVTKLLGVLFMFVLCANGVLHLASERANWKRKYRVLTYFMKRNVRGGSMPWLWMCAFMNIWSVLSTLGASYVCFATSSAPGDVMYNALALTFLYNLDDVGGEVHVVSGANWPAAGLGWIEKRIIEVEMERPVETPFFDFVYDVLYYVVSLLAVVASVDLAITDFVMV